MTLSTGHGRTSCETRLAGDAGIYREWRPVGPLADQLACTWMNALPRLPTPPLRIVPDGCIDIVWSGEDLRVAGPDTQTIVESFAPGTMIVGVRFRPGAAPPWLGVPALEIVDGRFDLRDFWGTDAQRLADRLHGIRAAPRQAADLMASALLSRLPHSRLFEPAGPAIAAALGRDDGMRTRLSELCAALGLSERTLRRRCESAFGYGPKTLERILRFQRCLRLLRGPAAPGLAELAAVSGFADQAHMTREVRALSGLTPAAFMNGLAA